jgi:uridylate kinase
MTTDTAAALRAIEIEAQVLLKATHHVDGIYTADPQKDSTAKKFDKLTHTEALHMRSGVMDSTALSLCLENKLPIIVFDFRTKNSIQRAVMGESLGTIVSGG